jgi:hypothetical protein
MDITGVRLRDAELKAKQQIVETWMRSENGKDFRDWCVSQPHPKGWNGKSLLNDVQYWLGRGMDKGLPKLRKALKAFGKGDAAELLEAEKKAEAHRLEKAKRNGVPRLRNYFKSQIKSEQDCDPFSKTFDIWFEVLEAEQAAGKSKGEAREIAWKAKANAEKELEAQGKKRRDYDAEKKAIDEMSEQDIWQKGLDNHLIRNGKVQRWVY